MAPVVFFIAARSHQFFLSRIAPECATHELEINECILFRKPYIFHLLGCNICVMTPKYLYFDHFDNESQVKIATLLIQLCFEKLGIAKYKQPRVFGIIGIIFFSKGHDPLYRINERLFCCI